jgi:hypothetical protein
MIRKLGAFTALFTTAMLSFAVSASAQPVPWQIG